jgi:hypothetical protein
VRIEVVLGGVSGSTLLGHSGVTAISSGASSVSPTFAANFADTTYALTFSVVNTTDGSPIFLWGIATAKSTSGFTVTFNAATDTSHYVLEWHAIQAI